MEAEVVEEALVLGGEVFGEMGRREGVVIKEPLKEIGAVHTLDLCVEVKG